MFSKFYVKFSKPKLNAYVTFVPKRRVTDWPLIIAAGLGGFTTSCFLSKNYKLTKVLEIIFYINTWIGFLQRVHWAHLDEVCSGS